MEITRRDFLNGMAVAVVAGMSPMQLLYGKQAKTINDMILGNENYYPPILTGLRGSTDQSYEFAHMLRDGDTFDFASKPIEERYDLVIVGAGISGLSAACFYRDKTGKETKILILDNHDDFGGHAKRNEFHTSNGLILSYGGSESFQSPKSLYGKRLVKFLKSLGIDIDELGAKFDVNFYPDLKLSRGVFFNKQDFGVNKVVAGSPSRVIADDIPPHKLNGRSYEDFINDFPMPESDRKALLEFLAYPKDYLEGMSKKQREEYAESVSYRKFLEEKVKLSPKAIMFFEGAPSEFTALDIGSLSCADARDAGMPGFDKMKLPPLSKEARAEIEEPYIYHFPDGNASVARLIVQKLIPSIANIKSMEDVVLAKFDYSKLDMPDSPTRIRLQATVINAKNVKDGVEVSYASSVDKAIHKVFAKKVIMANYNAMIPYIVPDMPEAQKDALAQAVKTPLVHTKVIINNWEPFIKLGVHEIFSPRMFYIRTKLDYPVDMGGYKHPRDPKKPICVHMVGAPIAFNRGNVPDDVSARDQARLARHQLFNKPFSELEQITRDHLQDAFGSAGFNHKRDIQAITLNRWGHCYAYSTNSLFDDEEESEKLIKIARKPFGNIVIANSDSAWDAYMSAAIEQAYRAVNELKL